MAQKVKNLSAVQETWVQSLGREDPLEKGMDTQSSILAWRIPWTGEPGRLQSMGSQRVRHNWAMKHIFIFMLCAVLCLVTQLCPTLCDSTDCSPPGSSVHGISQARILEWVAIPFSRGSLRPMDGTQISHIAGELFTTWVIGNPKKTGVSSLSFLQENFPTQELNWGILHCRRIIYQLSYQGSPLCFVIDFIFT